MTRLSRTTGSLVIGFVLMGLISGCSQEPDAKKMPTPPTEAEKASASATEQRMAELKKQHPNVPDDVLAGIAARQGNNPNAGPPRQR